MDHRMQRTDGRSVSEILADARALQGRHGPGVLDAAMRWLRAEAAARAGDAPTPSHRQLVLH